MEEWNKINSFLKRFQGLVPPERTKKRIIKEIIQEVARIDIHEDNILIQNDTVFLNISPMYKQHIILHKERIFSQLKAQYPKSEIRDLR